MVAGIWQELKSINQSTKMAPPEENVQNQPEPQIPLQTVVFNDLAGVKAPEFDWHSDDLPGAFQKFKRYCQLMLSTSYIRKQVTKGESELHLAVARTPRSGDL